MNQAKQQFKPASTSFMDLLKGWPVQYCAAMAIS